MPFATEALQAFFRPAEAADRPRAFFLQREGGLGDVIMALGAVHALRNRYPDARIFLHTGERYLAMAERCPHLDGAFPSEGLLYLAWQEHIQREYQTEYHQLGATSFGINRDHEVNAFLLEMGLHASPSHKTPVVELRPQEEDKARRRVEYLLSGFPRPWILLHPARGDRNRTWLEASWHALADRILAEGGTPVLVGDELSSPNKGVQKLQPREGVAVLTNELDLLEMIQLCRMADVLVSPDSGPIQLAALSDIGIVGLYTTVPPRCRLPFRHGMLGWRAEGLVPACPHRGCYHLILKNEAYFQQLQEAARKDLESPNPHAINTFMGDYCVQPDDKYRCLQEITPDQAWEACARLMDAERHRGQASQLERAGASILEGRFEEALEAAEAVLALREGPEGIQVQALALLGLGRSDEALARLKYLVANWPGPEPLNLLGVAFRLRGEEDQIDRVLDLAAKWNRVYLPALMNRALRQAALARREGRPVEALLVLELFARLRGELPVDLRSHVFPSAQAHLIKGWTILESFGPGSASACFEDAIREAPDALEGFLGLAESYYQNGQGEEAAALFSDIIEVDADCELARRRLEALAAGRVSSDGPKASA